MLYIILGPPASGKGTQAELLSKAIGLPHISTGAVLRELKEQRPEIGDLIDNGKVVTDDLIREIYAIVAKRFSEGLILDGAIRSVNQVEIILEFWTPNELRVVWLDIPDQVIRARSVHRDATSQDKRPDDRLSIVDERIEYYHSTKNDIIEHLRQYAIEPIIINGDQSVEAVQADIQKVIE